MKHHLTYQEYVQSQFALWLLLYEQDFYPSDPVYAHLLHVLTKQKLRLHGLMLLHNVTVYSHVSQQHLHEHHTDQLMFRGLQYDLLQQRNVEL